MPALSPTRRDTLCTVRPASPYKNYQTTMFGAARMAVRSFRAVPRFALAAGAAAGAGSALYNYSAPPAQAAASIPEMLATIAGKVEALEAKMNAQSTGGTGFGSFDMAGKTVVITGGASGIGFGMCELFSQRGAKVFCLDLFPEAVKKAEDALGPLVTGIACNVADADAVTSAFAQIKTAGYRCDVVINNACACISFSPPRRTWRSHPHAQRASFSL